MLGDHPNGCDAQISEVLHLVIRENRPGGLLYHVRHFLPEELLEFVGGLVRTSCDGGILAGRGPGCSFDDNGRASQADVSEESLGFVGDAAKVGKVSSTLLVLKVCVQLGGTI
jgi:hypothetical protein